MRRDAVAIVAGAAVLAAVVFCAACAWVDDNPVAVRAGGRPHGDELWGRVFLAAFVVAFVAYLAGLWAVRRRGPVRAVVVLAAAIQLAPLGAPLLLSTDAWSYWAYAKVDNPYRDPPADAAAAGVYAGGAWRDRTSVYGPAFSIATEPMGAVDSPDAAAWTFKIVAAASVVAAAALVARRSRAPVFAAAFVGWNPVLAIHFAGGGHNDAPMIALVVAALALAQVGRRNAAGVAWALAVLVKWVALLLLPLRALEARATRRPVAHLGFAATVAVVAATACALYGLSWLDVLSPLTDNASRETRYALPHRLGLPSWSLLVPFAVGYAWLVREAARGRARLGLALALLLLATPYLAVWYVVWAVPLAAADDDRPAQLLSLALCAYLLPQTVPT